MNVAQIWKMLRMVGGRRLEASYVAPLHSWYRDSRTEVLFTLGEVFLRFPPQFIAVRSAPDPTLDMDLRVGNFLLAE